MLLELPRGYKSLAGAWWCLPTLPLSLSSTTPSPFPSLLFSLPPEKKKKKKKPKHNTRTGSSRGRARWFRSHLRLVPKRFVATPLLLCCAVSEVGGSFVQLFFHIFQHSPSSPPLFFYMYFFFTPHGQSLYSSTTKRIEDFGIAHCCLTDVFHLSLRILSSLGRCLALW